MNHLFIWPRLNRIVLNPLSSWQTIHYVTTQDAGDTVRMLGKPIPISSSERKSETCEINVLLFLSWVQSGMMTILGACLCCLTAAGWMTDGGVSIWEWDVGSSCVWCCDLAFSLHTLACSSGNLTLCTWPHDFALFRYYLFAWWATLNIFIRSERHPNNEIGPLYPCGPQTHNSAVEHINSPRHIIQETHIKSK